VFDRLRGGQQAGVERGRIDILLHDLLALVQNPLDGVALLPADRLIQHLEDLLETLDLAFGLIVMFFEAVRSSSDAAAFAMFGSDL
jgi:hypothetical protein